MGCWETVLVLPRCLAFVSSRLFQHSQTSSKAMRCYGCTLDSSLCFLSQSRTSCLPQHAMCMPYMPPTRRNFSRSRRGRANSSGSPTTRGSMHWFGGVSKSANHQDPRLNEWNLGSIEGMRASLGSLRCSGARCLFGDSSLWFTGHA